MSPLPRLEFGYSPPIRDREFGETIRPASFVTDLHRIMDVASQGFTSFWLGDHLQFGVRYQHECWTQLAWLAARYPTVRLGTLVMANSFRSPALLAKMAATLQVLSGGRL